MLLVALRSSALMAGGTLGLIVLFLISESLPFARGGHASGLVLDRSWHPREGSFGVLPMIAGTVVTTVGAVAVALPLGLLAAVFSTYHAPPWLETIFRRIIELLAGIPSVVYGFWGLVTLVPVLARIHPPGTNVLAGILILALMILPTITLISETALRQLPREYLSGAAALGMGRTCAVWRVLVPAARPGIVTATLLAAARALGETMAVLMVCGNVVKMPASLFDPVRTLTANIALEMEYAVGGHRSALFATGLVLLLLVGALVGAVELTRRRRSHA